MTSPIPTDGRCNANTQDGGYCEMYPAKQDGSVINGKCYKHGGRPSTANYGKERKEAYEDYQEREERINRLVETNRSEYYQNVDVDEQAWIDRMINSYLDDAPFDVHHIGKLEFLRQTVIDLHKIRRANKFIDSEGLTQEVVVGVNDNGVPITSQDENTLNLAIDRLERSTTKRLKQLGCLDDPASQQAEASESLATVLSKSMESEDDGE